jgi:hypothetical protein
VNTPLFYRLLVEGRMFGGTSWRRAGMLGAPGEHMCVGRCLPPAPSVLRIVHIPSPIHGLASPVLLLHCSEPYRRSTTKAAEPRTIPPVTLKARKTREEIVSPGGGMSMPNLRYQGMSVRRGLVLMASDLVVRMGVSMNITMRMGQ